MQLRADSTIYVKATVTADHDLTGKQIAVALPLTGVAPVLEDWHAAETTSVVQTVLTSGSERWTATYRILIGPETGVVTLTPATYDWTRRITDTPEVPVARTGTLTVVAI